jgi:hypothetical protein
VSHSTPQAAQTQPSAATSSRVVTLGAACLVTLGGCAIITDGAIASDPVGSYVFLLLAIAAALYLISQVGQAVKRVAELIGTLIVIAARLTMISVLFGTALTIAACTVMT